MTQQYLKDKKGRRRWHYYSRGRWIPTPLDRYGFPKVAWLRKHGAPLLRSEIKVERHRSLCGKFVYDQGYRFDHYGPDVRPPCFACSNEFRGSDAGSIVCWPINTETRKPC